ncbi:hypothetical protein AQJ84_21940 [Streptomyces resistomycificus]|uniref:Uncharacterized protein n=2 Tax=Streptomyces resistomycificus TaxID=67356 RepID=A0A0L8LU61_9ACTN|nr:hypothetical protein ADK37_06455 [Streptomyces resistomycificus]KUN95842.1 hypothetical protein AQJ84_21940 [Streptomyces resistomycificus]
MLTAVAVPVAVAALTLAGCGQTRAGAKAASAPSSASPTSTSSATPRHISAELREVEDSTCGTTTPRPSAARTSASPSPRVGEDRPPNYGDNNAYRRTLPLKGLAVCRGEAHVRRLTEQLRGVPVDRAEVDAALSRLGYGDQVERVGSDGDGVRFVIGLDGVCVTGTLGPSHDDTVEAHGPYMEGGCVEPAYGH